MRFFIFCTWYMYIYGLYAYFTYAKLGSDPETPAGLNKNWHLEPERCSARNSHRPAEVYIICVPAHSPIEYQYNQFIPPNINTSRHHIRETLRLPFSQEFTAYRFTIVTAASLSLSILVKILIYNPHFTDCKLGCDSGTHYRQCCGRCHS